MTQAEKKSFSEVTSEIFDEVKGLQEDNNNTTDISSGLRIELEVVNLIFTSKDHSEFLRKANLDRAERILPATLGYYRGLVAQKGEENSSLKEQRGWLLEQVYFLRKAVKFLEVRKQELETAVRDMEKNINIGITALEQLYENDTFTQISDKVNKKNK